MSGERPVFPAELIDARPTESERTLEALRGIWAPPKNDAPPSPAIRTTIEHYDVSCPGCLQALYPPRHYREGREYWYGAELVGTVTCPRCGQVAILDSGE